MVTQRFFFQLIAMVCALMMIRVASKEQSNCVEIEDMEKLKQELESLDKEKQTLHRDLKKLTAENVEQLKVAHVLLDEKIKQYEDKAEEAAVLAKDHNTKLNEVKKLNQAIDSSARHIQELRQGLKAAKDENALHLQRIEHLTHESKEAEEERITSLRSKIRMMQTKMDQLSHELSEAKHSMNLHIVLSDAFDRASLAMNDAYSSAQLLGPWAKEKYQQAASIYDQHGRHQLQPVVQKAHDAVEHVSKLVTNVYDQHCHATLNPVIKSMRKRMKPYLSSSKTLLNKLWTNAIKFSKESYTRFLYGRKMLASYAAENDISPTYARLGVNVMAGLFLAPIALFLIRFVGRFSYLLLSHLIGVFFFCFCCGACRQRRKKERSNSPSMKLKRPSSHKSRGGKKKHE